MPGLSLAEIEELVARRNALRMAGEKLHRSVLCGSAALRDARAEEVSRRDAEARRPMHPIVRWHFFFAAVAIGLLCVVGLWGNAMPFTLTCDLLCVMLAALFTALVLLALIVWRDCRARRKDAAQSAIRNPQSAMP